MKTFNTRSVELRTEPIPTVYELCQKHDVMTTCVPTLRVDWRPMALCAATGGEQWEENRRRWRLNVLVPSAIRQVDEWCSTLEAPAAEPGSAPFAPDL